LGFKHRGRRKQPKIHDEKPGETEKSFLLPRNLKLSKKRKLWGGESGKRKTTARTAIPRNPTQGVVEESSTEVGDKVTSPH